MNRCLISIVLVCLSLGAMAQTDTVQFCNDLAYFLSDASKNFIHVKGSLADSSGNNFVYSATKGLPGAQSSNVLDVDNIVVYEATMYEGAAKETMTERYLHYKTLLGRCLSSAGYLLVTEKNENQFLEECPILKYTKTDKEPIVVLRAQQSDINNLYSVTISVNK